jgi:hypothetical protein
VARFAEVPLNTTLHEHYDTKNKALASLRFL